MRQLAQVKAVIVDDNDFLVLEIRRLVGVEEFQCSGIFLVIYRLPEMEFRV